MKKLNFTEFINEVVEKIAEKMGENVRIDIHDTIKNNDVSYKAINILREDCNISPNIRLESYYEDYQNGMDLDTIVENMMLLYENAAKQNINMNSFMDFEQAKNHIMIKLIAYGKNKERLKNIPHIKFLDFAVTYYYYCNISDDLHRNASIQIENEHLEKWGVEKEELHRLAVKNSREKLPVKFQTISDIIVGILNDKGLEASQFDDDIQMMQDQVPMYVLSNDKNYFGAAVIYYPEVLKEIGRLFQTDFIILPSSIHEVIVLPVTGGEKYEEFNKMIREINDEQVADEEVLSDHLYYYNYNTEKLMIPSVSL